MQQIKTTDTPPSARTARPSAPVLTLRQQCGRISLAVLAVIITTAGLLALNKIVSAEEPTIYVRPYTGVYILTVLALTWIGGRILGFFTLGLSILASLYFILPPRGWEVAHPSDWMGLFLLALNAGVVIIGLDGQRQKAALVAEAAGARHESALHVQEAIEAQSRLQSVVAAAQEQRQVTILPQLLLPLLPDHIPGLDLRIHFEALLEDSSGDTPFFDCFRVQDDLTALIVGTVAETGLSAPTTVVMLRGMLRSAVLRRATVAEAVTELNAMLVTHSILAGPCRLFIGLYESTSRTLNSVSCGALTALARRSESAEVLELAAAGPLLGATPDTPYRQQTLALHPGDLLVISPGDPETSRAAEGQGWKEALTGQQAGGDAQQWISRLMQDRPANGTARPDGNLCLLVALVPDPATPGRTGDLDAV